MKKLTAYLLFITLLCQPFCSCRSTLYRAAEKGDYATVKQELESGTRANHSIRGTNSPLALLMFPICITAISLDLTLAVCTLGAYTQVGRKDVPPITAWFMKTPLDEALDHGHYDIASLLRAYGATATYSKHYYGDFSTPATEKPKIKQKKVNLTQQKEEHAEPAPSLNTDWRPTMPQPGIGGAAGSISTH